MLKILSGTFTGDEGIVTISPIDDSLNPSISFLEDGVIYGWKNIRAYDKGCWISILTDSINEISLGETYKLAGSGHKRGNQLKFSLRAYYHGISPLYFYDFTVTKTE